MRKAEEAASIPFWLYHLGSSLGAEEKDNGKKDENGAESRLSENPIYRNVTGREEEKNASEISTIVDVYSLAQPLVPA